MRRGEPEAPTPTLPPTLPRTAPCGRVGEAGPALLMLAPMPLLLRLLLLLLLLLLAVGAGAFAVAAVAAAVGARRSRGVGAALALGDADDGRGAIDCAERASITSKFNDMSTSCSCSCSCSSSCSSSASASTSTSSSSSSPSSPSIAPPSSCDIRRSSSRMPNTLTRRLARTSSADRTKRRADGGRLPFAPPSGLPIDRRAPSDVLAIAPLCWVSGEEGSCSSSCSCSCCAARRRFCIDCLACWKEGSDSRD
jgi:hypothetical protein